MWKCQRLQNAEMPEKTIQWRMRKCQNTIEENTIQWRSRNSRKDNTMEKPKCQKRQYNAEVTPSMLPSLGLSNPNSILENARKA